MDGNLLFAKDILAQHFTAQFSTNPSLAEKKKTVQKQALKMRVKYLKEFNIVQSKSQMSAKYRGIQCYKFLLNKDIVQASKTEHFSRRIFATKNWFCNKGRKNLTLLVELKRFTSCNRNEDPTFDKFNNLNNLDSHAREGVSF